MIVVRVLRARLALFAVARREFVPAAESLSLLRQRREPKKGDPTSAPFGFPRLGPVRREKKNSPFWPSANGAQTIFFLLPPPRPQSRRSTRGLCRGHPRSPAGRETCARPAWRCAASCVALHPLAAARSAAARGLPAAGRSNKVVRAPLARRAKRASFLCSPSGREHRSEPGTPGAGVGSPFFAYFLWRSKESEPAAGRDPRRAATTRTRREEGKE